MRMRRVTLIWTLVALAAALGIAIPWLISSVVDASVVSIGQSVARDLSLARGSAIAKNQRVQFRLDDNGSILVSTEHDGREIQHDSSTASSNVNIALSPRRAHLATFNGLGWSVGNTDGSPSIRAVDVQAGALRNFVHPSRRIILSAAGSVVLCDPGANGNARLACAQAGEYRATSALTPADL